MIAEIQPAGRDAAPERLLSPDILEIQEELETADEKRRLELMVKLRNISYYLQNR